MYTKSTIHSNLQSLPIEHNMQGYCTFLGGKRVNVSAKLIFATFFRSYKKLADLTSKLTHLNPRHANAHLSLAFIALFWVNVF